MKAQLGVMIDVEEALYKLEEQDMYSAGLAFFSALGYSVEPLEIAINESMSRFVYVISKNRCVFSRDERNAIQSVASISWLFTLSNDIKVSPHVRESIVNNIHISSINYFCIELDCTLHDRSVQAFILTKIISKVVNTPIVVLFKHADHLLLSSVYKEHGKDKSTLRTYLSDWYLFNPVHEDVLMTLSNWHLGNYYYHNLYIFFMDWVHSMARPYFFNSENYEYVRFGWNSIALRNQSNYKEIIMVDGVYYSVELAEQIVKQDPRDFYGFDYVNDDGSIEINIDDKDWIQEELYYLDETELISADTALNNNGEVKYDDGKKEEFAPENDINSIDNTVFKDPIKMLEYLESLDQTK